MFEYLSLSNLFELLLPFKSSLSHGPVFCNSSIHLFIHLFKTLCWAITVLPANMVGGSVVTGMGAVVPSFMKFIV